MGIWFDDVFGFMSKLFVDCVRVCLVLTCLRFWVWVVFGWVLIDVCVYFGYFEVKRCCLCLFGFCFVLGFKLLLHRLLSGFNFAYWLYDSLVIVVVFVCVVKCCFWAFWLWWFIVVVVLMLGYLYFGLGVLGCLLWLVFALGLRLFIVLDSLLIGIFAWILNCLLKVLWVFDLLISAVLLDLIWLIC